MKNFILGEFTGKLQLAASMRAELVATETLLPPAALHWFCCSSENLLRLLAPPASSGEGYTTSAELRGVGEGVLSECMWLPVHNTSAQCATTHALSQQLAPFLGTVLQPEPDSIHRTLELPILSSGSFLTCSLWEQNWVLFQICLECW